MIARAVGVRLVGVIGVGGALTLGLLLWRVVRERWAAVVAPGPADSGDALTLLLALAALAVLAWLVAGVVLETLAALPGSLGRAARRAADRLAPALLTRLVALALGTAVGTTALPATAVAGAARPGLLVGTRTTVSRLVDPSGPPTAATPHPLDRAPEDAPEVGFAAPPGSGAPGIPPTSTTPRAGHGTAPDPRFVPQRPAVRRVPTPAVLGSRGLPAPDGVVVHRGDTLWSIAAAALGPDATDPEVARAWPRWYAANRHLIGPDPDLLRPGQVLRVPTPATAR